MWRAVLDRIPTRVALRKRNISVGSDLCVLCGDGIETVDHLFSACNKSLRVWERLSEWMKIPHIYAFSIFDLLEVHKGVDGDYKAKDIVKGLILVTCWAIWKARNAKNFSDGKGDSGEFFGEVRSLGFLWLKIDPNTVILFGEIGVITHCICCSWCLMRSCFLRPAVLQ
ncbi:uncharacterized protein LOC110919072 [Helianthus annuus]|uniref:uncharacterized protein LOC110919072 n=1 Tax=Helianthus annuus TaxID=4232 RepID=UPI000B8EF71B|nr:uncharacterized protein LOC110919072 [Helianthus annuus]